MTPPPPRRRRGYPPPTGPVGSWREVIVTVLGRRDMTLHAIWLMVSLVLSLAVAMTIAHVHVSWQMIDRIMHTLSLIMRL